MRLQLNKVNSFLNLKHFVIHYFEPLKKPMHTIIPGLLTNNNDETIMSYGVMGGQYQPIGQAHLLQNVFEFGLSMQEAIDAQRAFALNGKLKVEKSIPN